MLKIGTAKVEITPAAGSLMACFPVGPKRIPRRAEGAHDPILVRVLMLSDGVEKVAICSCDLCGIREQDVQAIRRLVGREIPELNGPRLCLAASHSHSAPETLYLFGNTPADPWIKNLHQSIADAVVSAQANQEPCPPAFSCIPLPANHNRRVIHNGKASMAMTFIANETNGPCDEDVSVLFFSAGQTVKSLLYNYTAHALTMGPHTRTYTADYPGAANRFLEQSLPGATALFTNGAAGNIHPRNCMQDNWEVMEATGRQLGQTILTSLKASEPLAVDRLLFRSETLMFSNRADPSLKVPVELSILGLGPLKLAFVPGEYFNEFQLMFKARTQPYPGILIGYANGWPGYIPTRDAYAAGGYGVDLCTSDPAELSRTSLPPGSGEAILETLLNLAKQS